ncbi:hypothetical protein ColLi_09149 [Colletotrichum liriopes]|uniref:Uncharacterized protein n=1 Tax=Colletotrichum liriopes TaxID=708192 RepID=A0AA37GSA0_9PEZI|nr:hypothetical protein ColLi_09149 [Colletotrichum liriopes]
MAEAAPLPQCAAGAGAGTPKLTIQTPSSPQSQSQQGGSEGQGDQKQHHNHRHHRQQHQLYSNILEWFSSYEAAIETPQPPSQLESVTILAIPPHTGRSSRAPLPSARRPHRAPTMTTRSAPLTSK